MKSLLLQTAARLLLPLLLLFSVYLFWRGHNEPGGGFVAGLTAAAAWAMYSIAYDSRRARAAIRVEPRVLIGVGLLLVSASGLLGLFAGDPFLTGQWTRIPLPGFGLIDLGSPVLFDLGVFLTVQGVTLGMIFSLSEVEK